MLYGPTCEATRHLLRQIRKNANLTQAELAQKLGRGQSYVSKVERGEQYIDLVEFLDWCRACGAKPLETIERL